MVAMYCLYHGRQGLRNIANSIHSSTWDLSESMFIVFRKSIVKIRSSFLTLCVGVKSAGHVIKNNLFFDTLQIQPKTSIDEIKIRASEKHINLRYYPDGSVSNGRKL